MSSESSHQRFKSDTNNADAGSNGVHPDASIYTTAESLREIINDIIQADITLADKAARFHNLTLGRSGSHTIRSGKSQSGVSSSSSSSSNIEETTNQRFPRGLFGLALDWVWPIAQSDRPTAERISALYILASMYTQAVALDPFRGVYNDVWVSGRLASDIIPALTSASPSDSAVLSTVGLVLLLGKSHLIKHSTPSEVIRQCPPVRDIVRPSGTHGSDSGGVGVDGKDGRLATVEDFEFTVCLSLDALIRSLGLKERKTLSRSLSQMPPSSIPGLFVPSEIPPLVLSNPSIGIQVVRSILSLDQPLDVSDNRSERPDHSARTTTTTAENDQGREQYAMALGTLPPSLSSLDVFSNLFRPNPDPLMTKTATAAAAAGVATGGSPSSPDTHVRSYADPDGNQLEKRRKEENIVRDLLKAHALGRFVSNFINELDRMDCVRGEDEQVGRLVRILSLFLSNLLQTTDLVLPETILIESTSFALRFSRFEDAQRLYVLLSSASASASAPASSASSVPSPSS